MNQTQTIELPTETKTRDEYDDAIDYLNEYPEKIYDAWNHPHYHSGGCLFKIVTPSGREGSRPDGALCGCLSQIRDGWYTAWTDALTKEIKEDLSIPTNPRDITTHHLPIFARWQRRLRRELNQV